MRCRRTYVLNNLQSEGTYIHIKINKSFVIICIVLDYSYLTIKNGKVIKCTIGLLTKQ